MQPRQCCLISSDWLSEGMMKENRPCINITVLQKIPTYVVSEIDGSGSNFKHVCCELLSNAYCSCNIKFMNIKN